MAESCENCRFCKSVNEDDPEEQEGRCYRYPPHTHRIGGSTIISVFPPVFVDDWCGEWQAKMPLDNQPATSQNEGDLTHPRI